LSKKEEGVDQRQSAVKDTKSSDGQGAQGEADDPQPEIPQELEDVSRKVEKDLKDAIEAFMSKGHEALDPKTKGVGANNL
jgi:hypothetical protein